MFLPQFAAHRGCPHPNCAIRPIPCALSGWRRPCDVQATNDEQDPGYALVIDSRPRPANVATRKRRALPLSCAARRARAALGRVRLEPGKQLGDGTHDGNSERRGQQMCRYIVGYFDEDRLRREGKEYADAKDLYEILTAQDR